MKISTKTRIVFSICITVVALAFYLATNHEGVFIPIAFIITPLMLLAPIIITGAYICPKCNNGIYSAPDGEADINPYYMPLSGRCRYCGESI
jgi:hypothetical protein